MFGLFRFSLDSNDRVNKNQRNQVIEELMKRTEKYRDILLITYGIVLFVVLTHFSQVWEFMKYAIGLLTPVVMGFILAFILNVPKRGFEKLLEKISKKRKRGFSEKTIHLLSLFLTLVSVILMVCLVGVMLIPEVIRSVVSAYNQLLTKIPEWITMMKKYDIDTTLITEWAASLNIDQLVKQFTSGAGTLISSAVGIVSTTFSGIGTFGIAVIIAIYALISKKDMMRQAKKIITANCRESAANNIFHVAELINTTYSKFLSGQCAEACILGTMMTLVFTILRIPYASLIGVLTAVFAFIPYVGAFLACGIGVFLVLLSEPEKVIICIVAYLVVQFVENQFIYPNVVGTSVGLSPMWTLIAVLLGVN